jgi:hypothetical protein
MTKSAIVVLPVPTSAVNIGFRPVASSFNAAWIASDCTPYGLRASAGSASRCPGSPGSWSGGNCRRRSAAIDRP